MWATLNVTQIQLVGQRAVGAHLVTATPLLPAVWRVNEKP